MKIKSIATVIATVTCLYILAGCGEGTTDQNNNTVTDPEPTVSVTQDVQETAPADEETVDSNKISEVLMSSWTYDDLFYINKKYLLAKEDNKYILIKTEDGEQVNNTWTYFEEEYPYEFDRIYTNLQDGYFIGIIKLDDGQYVSSLFDGKKCKSKYAFKGKVFFSDYLDELVKYENNESIGVFDISNDYGIERRYGYEKSQCSNLTCSYGTLFVISEVYDKENNCYASSLDVDNLKELLLSENWGQSTFESRGEKAYSFNDKPVYFWNSVANKDGWIRATVFNDFVKNEDGTIEAGEGQSGFYNITSNDFVKDPIADNPNCAYFTIDNGRDICTVTDNKAAILVGEAQAEDDDGQKNLYQIFDLGIGEFASDEKYRKVDSFGYHKYVLVENEEGKWGYIDNDSLEHVGDWYDNASAFCNGYAVVVSDETGYLIDEEFNKISVDFDAEKVVAITDYYTFFDISGASAFFVQYADDWHYLVVKQKE